MPQTKQRRPGGGGVGGAERRLANMQRPRPLAAVPAARIVSQSWDRIVRWQGAFWAWRNGAYSLVPDDGVRAAIYTALERLGEEPESARVSTVADALAAVVLLDDDLDPPCWITTGAPLGAGWAPCRNGILDLSTGDLSAPTTDLFALSALAVDFDAGAIAPQWERFLRQLWPEDQSSIDTLQEIFGYLISGETHQQKVFLIVGPKRAGKGTILRVLTALLGRNNCAAPTLSALTQNFGLQCLIGKSAAIISDARLSGRADQDAIAERLLSISGEDHVSVPRKFKADYTAQIGVRFVLATNELPRLHDTSGALASRFVPLVLSSSWYGQEDHGLTDRLLAELPGIMRWSVDGYRRLMGRGHFELPATSADAIQELHDLGSPVGAFTRECCVLGAGAETPVAELYRQWCNWCEAHGRSNPGTEQTFGRDIRAAAPGVTVAQPRRGGTRTRVYQGIGLADDWNATGTRAGTRSGTQSPQKKCNQSNSLEAGTQWHAHFPTYARGKSEDASVENNGVERVPSRASPSPCEHCGDPGGGDSDGGGCKWCRA